MKQNTSVSLFDLCSPILFNCLYYGKLLILKDVLFRFSFPSISKGIICVLTGGTIKAKCWGLKTEKAIKFNLMYIKITLHVYTTVILH